MKILIAAIGKLKNNNPENLLIKEYTKRINWKIDIKEYESKNSDKKEEEFLLENSINYKRILLCEHGKEYNSIEFARTLQKYQESSNNVAFLIGGASGHGKNVTEQVDSVIALSRLTFPHLIARMLLIEQIYRAYTIIQNHPYHK